MEVNIRAFSDALDGLLAAEAGGETHKPHSAIVHRRPPQPQGVATSQRRTADAVAAALPEPAEPPQLTNERQSKRRATPITEADSSPAAELNESGATPIPHLEGAAVSDREKSHLTKKSVRKSQSPPLHRSGEQKRSGLRTASPEWHHDGADSFLGHLGTMEIVAATVVEASGVGASSVLLTPSNVSRRLSRVQLSSKRWVTDASLTRRAFALFSLGGGQSDVRQQRTLPSAVTDAGNDNGCGDAAGTSVVRDITVTLVVEHSLATPSSKLRPLASARQKAHGVVVSIETSHSRYDGFVSSASAAMSSDGVVTLKLAGPNIARFVRLGISTIDSEDGGALIKVLAVCFSHADSWTAESVSPEPKVVMSLEEEVETARRSGATPRTQNIPDTAEKVFSGERANEVVSPAPPMQQDLTAAEKSEPAPLSCVDGGAEVARFVKDVALRRLRQQSAAPQKSCPQQEGQVEYDWLLDALVNVASPADGQGGTAYRAASSPASAVETESEEPVNEYIRTLQAWNSVPGWSVEHTLEFFLSQTTSFSASTISAPQLFGPDVQDHLSLPFRLHLLFVGASEEESWGSTQGARRGGRLPPVAFMSAVASGAASIGYTMELLCSCPASNGFGCALRPHSRTSERHDASCKLLLVVPAYKGSVGEDADIPSVAAVTLRTALAIFCRGPGERSDRERCTPPQHSHGEFPLTKPYGVLRLLMDSTRSLDALLPVVSDWARVAGSIRYYGSASQLTLRLLFFPTHMVSSGGGGDAGPRAEAQWSTLRLQLCGLWRSKASAVDGAAESIVAVEAHYQCPATYAWQSRRTSLRLVLTDAHFAEFLTRVDGFVAPSALVRLAAGYVGGVSGTAAGVSSLISFSEAPWISLVRAVEQLFGPHAAAALPPSEERVADFFALRRRVTVSFVFHVLSTAFKRSWVRVSASVPLCDGRVRGAAAVLERALAPSREGGAAGDRSFGGALGLLDEDAFMDTIFQWRYPYPSVLLLHCTDVLHCHTMLASTSAAPMIRDGVGGLFSDATLRSFAAVASPTEALS
ncbi:hypothetical protein NESM_000029200 [Novymonas esmeraldas]|uniref:Uncharacterized protein n=1 Tax=Novymonas esmeraldas TaxID=1808958 RepID=A0AAW0F2G7_9TRYP